LRILVVRLYSMTTPPACRQATGCNSVGYQDSACKFLLEMVTTWHQHADGYYQAQDMNAPG